MAASFEVPLLSPSLPASWLGWHCPADPVSIIPIAGHSWHPTLLRRSTRVLPPPTLQPTLTRVCATSASLSPSSAALSLSNCPLASSTTQWLPIGLQQRALRCISACCSSSTQEAAEERPQDANSDGRDEDGWAEKKAQPDVVPRPWPRSAAAAELVASYQRQVAHEGGHLVIQPLNTHYYEATVDLLAVCFADSIDAASLLGYIRSQIVKYLREQERFFAKGQGVCLVALWTPHDVSAPDPLPPPPPTVVGTVSLAFAVRSLPRFPTLNVPGDRSNAYLSNMAVQPSHRRRGVARELLTASEELSAALGKRALYLHVRFVDDVPQRVYSSAGYSVVARDTVLSWLFLQRRRSLMRKQLPRRSTPIDTSIRVQDIATA